MKVVVQRCENASVLLDTSVIGRCDVGLLLLVGFTEGDSQKEIDYMVHKILHLRIFPDENGVMNQSVLDVGGSILSVSQFTLYADTKNGNRPSYMKALKGSEAVKLYDLLNQELAKYIPVETGKFGSDMKIEFTNVGPTTILLEKEGEK